MLQAFRNRLENGDLLIKGRLLSYVGDTNPLLDVQVAIVWLGQSPQNFEQRRFACSVAPDQANALRGFKGKAGVIQQCDMPKCELGVQ